MLIKYNRFLFFISALAVLIYLALKSNFQSFSHDEAATFFHYIHKENFLPWLAHWDANNHILNSILSWICYKIFGADPFWLRLPNLLSFILFAYFIYKSSLFLKNITGRYLFQLAMMTAIFPLDFFSLCRGYGMSLAFLWGAFYYLVLFFRTQRFNHALFSWLLIIAAVWANLSLLNNYLILIGIHLLYLTVVIRTKRAQLYLLLIFPGIAGYIFASVYALQLKEKGLLYYGSLDGLMEVTIKTLSLFQFGTGNYYFLILLSSIISGAVLINLIPTRRTLALKNYFQFGSFIGVILLANVAGVLLLAYILNVNFPEDRAGLYFIPLSIAAFSFALDRLSEKWGWTVYVNIVLIAIPLNLLLHADLNKTQLWDSLYLSEEIYREAEKIQNEAQRPLTINAYFLYEMSWAYYNLQNGGKLSNTHFRPDRSLDLNADLLLMLTEDFDTLETDLYQKVYTQSFNSLALYQRKQAASKIVYHIPEYTGMKTEGESEFFEFFADTVYNKFHDILMQCDVVFSTEKHPFHSQIVIDTQDMEGNSLHYDYIPLHWIKSRWIQGEKRIARPIPAKNEAKVFVKMYLWNIDKQKYSGRIDTLRMYLIKHSDLSADIL